MKFNSIDFLIFLAIAFFTLWGLRKSLKAYNGVLLVASYVFYGWWDYRFLFLMFFSSIVDFTVGYYIPRSSNKKALMAVSLIINLGLLMLFKYFNFFINSAQDFMELFGLQANFHVLNIILPVGISFYTFQTLSYSLDVYKEKIKPETNFIAFLNYVSFFPQLVAGPIERAARFLPQFRKEKVFNYAQAVDGMRLLLYGLFKKMVIADNIGLRVDAVYANYQDHSGPTLLLATAMFFIQLYADFSAYTDIARGVAKLLGFELMENFKTPLFSKSVPEFWSRWHISLTTWFRDYLFIWLAGLNKKSTFWRITATVILFLVIGFWHGANYTFIVFGIFHGLFFIPRILGRKNRSIRESLQFLNTHKVASVVAMLFTFLLNTMTVVLFRSENITKAGVIYSSFISKAKLPMDDYMLESIPFALVLIVFEWFMQHKSHPFQVSGFNPWVRKALYVALIVSILFLGYFGREPFYYFQF